MSDQLCKGNRGRFGCQQVVTDGGEKDSGYCEKCFWPGIEEANQKYEELLQQGHSRVEAAELSGLNDGERHHRYGTTMIDTPQQDSAFTADDDDDSTVDEDEAQDDLTNHILSHLEDEGDAGDGPLG